MRTTDFKKVFGLMAVLSICFSGQAYAQADCCSEEEECVCENEGPAQHLHFSSQEIDIYDQTPDTVYKDADWPSRIEEYSDYLSH